VAAALLAVLSAVAVGSARTDASAHTDARKAARPNIVVIMTDDQTVESMRVMKNVRKLLVERGTTFDNNFTSFPLCCPSRSTFLTGQYAHNHHVLGNNLANGLVHLDQTNTLPVWLTAAGYHTTFVGKYLNEYRTLDGRRIPPGWTEWYAGLTLAYFNHTMNRNGKVVRYGSKPEDYQTDVYTRTAVSSIDSARTDPRPLFMWLSYFAPHYGGPREPNDPPDLQTTVAAPRHRGKFLNVPLPRPPSFNEADVTDKPAGIQNRPLLGESNVASLTSSYRQRLQSLLAVDDGVAKVIGALKTTGRLDNTLIIFTSDNGYLQGEHRVRDAKELVYENSIRVPLVIRGPGVPQSLHLQQLVMNTDLAPTILEAARAAPGRVEDGASMLPYFSDMKLETGRDILLERGPGGNNTGSARLYTAIRTPRFKYVENRTGEVELYDLQTDPDELESKDGDGEYATVQWELAQRLAALRDCVGEACRRGPQLQLRAESESGCVRTLRVDGADSAEVESVEYLSQGKQLRGTASIPFELRLAQGAQTQVRALVTLDDGRRLTLDTSVRACA
jgi:arylsulfatase A-like enzyme